MILDQQDFTPRITVSITAATFDDISENWYYTGNLQQFDVVSGDYVDSPCPIQFSASGPYLVEKNNTDLSSGVFPFYADCWRKGMDSLDGQTIYEFSRLPDLIQFVLWNGDPIRPDGYYPATIAIPDGSGGFTDGDNCLYLNPNQMSPLWDVDAYLCKFVGYSVAMSGMPSLPIYSDGQVLTLCRGTFGCSGSIPTDGSSVDLLVIDTYISGDWLITWCGDSSSTCSAISGVDGVKVAITTDFDGVVVAGSSGWLLPSVTPAILDNNGSFSITARISSAGDATNPIRFQGSWGTGGACTAASITQGYVTMVQVHAGDV